MIKYKAIHNLKNIEYRWLVKAMNELTLPPGETKIHQRLRNRYFHLTIMNKKGELKITEMTEIIKEHD